MKQEVIELWRLCFGDTEEFIHFYFDRKYRDEYTLAYREDNLLLSCLQMLPYPMTFAGAEITTSYISGACTHPALRGKGVMKNLLASAFNKMLSSGVGMSTLIPQEEWLFDYYRKLGYVTVFSYEIEKYKLRQETVSGSRAEVLGYQEVKAGINGLYHYFSGQMQQRPCCIQHDLEDFDVILEDLYLSSGRLVVVTDEAGSLAGMAFVFPTATKFRVQEWFYQTEQDKQALLQAILQNWRKEEVECKVPSPSSAIPGGMARIIDAGRMLGLYAARYPEKQLSLNLTDEILVANSGYYQLQGGVCRRQEQPGQRADFSMDISTLTRLLLGYQLEQLPLPYHIFESQQAYMSLMLD